MTRPRIPVGLDVAGKALWRRLVGEFEFGPAELVLLEAAGRQADDVAALERLLAEQGLVVAGSNGQPRLTAVVAELRQGRLALAKLLGELALPDENERPMSATSRRAQHAARARWARVDRIEERHRGTA